MLKIKYNELLQHFVELKKELEKCRGHGTWPGQGHHSPDSIRYLQSKNAEINRKLVENQRVAKPTPSPPKPRHVYYAEDFQENPV
jgi:hypothetical protein